MKKVVSLASVLLVAFALPAQPPSVSLSTEKTVSLIFPFAVVHVDRGTSDVLVKSVKEAKNMILLKAAAKNFPETNLSVVTGDGSLYSFRITYAATLNTWVYQLPVQKGPTVEMVASRLLDNPPIVSVRQVESGGVTAQVTGIYIHGPHLFFQLRLRNDSPVEYEVDFIRPFLRDQKRAKRTAVQEVELTPVAITGEYARVGPFAETVVVVVLDKFTVPEGEQFILQIGEMGGSRLLQVSVKGRQLLKGRLLSGLQ